jgi:hypothetical protein
MENAVRYSWFIPTFFVIEQLTSKDRDLGIFEQMSARFGRFLQVSALASHWPADCENFTPTAEENDKYSTNYSSQYTFIYEQLNSTCD